MPKKIRGCNTVSITLPDNSEHHIAFMMCTRNETKADTRKFMKFVFSEFPQPCHRVRANHWADAKFREVLHEIFKESARECSESSNYGEYGAILLYDMNHVEKVIKKLSDGKRQWQRFYKMYHRTKVENSDNDWKNVSDHVKDKLKRLKPAIEPPFLNGRKCVRDTLTISQRSITMIEQKHGTEGIQGMRTLEVIL